MFGKLFVSVILIAASVHLAFSKDFGETVPDVDEIVKGLKPKILPNKAEICAIHTGQCDVSSNNSSGSISLLDSGEDETLGIVRQVVKVSFRLSFGYASADIGAGEIEKLKRLASALQHSDLVGRRYKIVGHTDASGSDAANNLLSERCALAVVRLLTEMGVASGRLTAVGVGSKQSIYGSRPGAAENRRVEVILVSE